MPNQDRMPPIPDAEMTAAQRAVAQELVSGPRGKLAGPFVPLMRSP
jgi:4-carboxymuconolactone decarboxylase